MSDTNVLEHLFCNKAIIKSEILYKRKKVVLKEHQADNSRIEIRGVPDDAIIINLDSAFSNDKLFNGKKGECKRGDYIIFSEEKRKVLFIEMKKTSANLNDIVNQLKGSLCAFKYIQAITCEFFDEKEFLNTYKYRFISINHTGMSMRPTRIEKTNGKKNDKPTTPLKLSYTQTIEFNKIAA